MAPLPTSHMHRFRARMSASDCKCPCPIANPLPDVSLLLHQLTRLAGPVVRPELQTLLQQLRTLAPIRQQPPGTPEKHARSVRASAQQAHTRAAESDLADVRRGCAEEEGRDVHEPVARMHAVDPPPCLAPVLRDRRHVVRVQQHRHVAPFQRHSVHEPAPPKRVHAPSQFSAPRAHRARFRSDARGGPAERLDGRVKERMQVLRDQDRHAILLRARLEPAPATPVSTCRDVTTAPRNVAPRPACTA
eukprot:3413847-Rhodomonas_salina.1